MLGIALSKGMAEKVGFAVPMWLVFYCSSIIALGAIVGGIKVVKTVGTKVTKIERYQGTAADLSSAICLFVASLFGIPVSSTHVKNSSIMGVGASKRMSNVNWIVARNMVLTWIITFPCCGILGYSLTKIFIKFNVQFGIFSTPKIDSYLNVFSRVHHLENQLMRISIQSILNL